MRRAHSLGVTLSMVGGVSSALLVSGTGPLEARAAARGDTSTVRFVDVTEDAGLSTRPLRSYGSAWADYDGDGRPDLFSNRHWTPATLLHNVGGTFRKSPADFRRLPGYVTDRPGSMDRHDCAWGEADGDRVPDLACSQGAEWGSGSGPNQLVMRTPSGWVDRARRFGVTDPQGRGRTVNWLDFDRDGDLDMYLTNAANEGHPSVMFRNDKGRFERVQVGLELTLGKRALWPLTTWADWDDDLDPDVLVVADRTRAFENRDGAFVEIDLPGVTDGAWRSAAWGEFNGDRLPDLALVQRGRVNVALNLGDSAFVSVASHPLTSGRMPTWFDLHNDGDLDLFVVQGADPDSSENVADVLLVRETEGFTPTSAGPVRGPYIGSGDAASVADADGDGRVDLFVSNGHSPAKWKGPQRLLINRTPSQGWVGLRLRGRRWNPSGYGARLHVIAGTVSYWRTLNDGVTYHSQVDMSSVRLGIGDALQAQIRVEWPDGTTDCIEAQEGRVRRVGIGSSPCPLGSP